jgi:hypothetical protein
VQHIHVNVMAASAWPGGRRGGESPAVAHRPAAAATPWPAAVRDNAARRIRVRACVARGAPLLLGAGP